MPSIELNPAQRAMIKKIALGSVEVYARANGTVEYFGGSRQLVEELRRMKLVSTFRKTPSCWQYVLTDQGRWALTECFPVLEDGDAAPPKKTAWCRNCGRAFTPTMGRTVYCGHCGDPKIISRRRAYDKIMADDEKHARKIEAHRKWREWARENDPDYRARKREAQRLWRMRQRQRG